jgi:hypothetical protein
MKKTVWMIAAGVLVAGSLAFAQSEMKKPMAMKGDLANTLMHREQVMLEALQKKDIAGFKKYIMAGSWNVDENGYMTIDEFVKALSDPKANFTLDSFKASDMKVVNIDANAAIVTYKLDEKGAFMGQPFPPVVYATTVWANHGGTWMAVFHQESTAAAAKK